MPSSHSPNMRAVKTQPLLYMTKKLLGTAKPMAVLPGCFLLGGVFCMACDWIARTAFSPTELAISTVTAFFGAPVVIVMALKRGGGHR